MGMKQLFLISFLIEFSFAPIHLVQAQDRLESRALSEAAASNTPTRAQRNEAVLERIGVNNQCFKNIAEQVAYDNRNSGFFSWFGLKVSNGLTRAGNVVLSKKNETVSNNAIDSNYCEKNYGRVFNNPHETLEQFRTAQAPRLRGKLTISAINQIGSCEIRAPGIPNAEITRANKIVASRYFYGMGVIERYTSTLIDQIAAIDASLPSQNLPQNLPVMSAMGAGAFKCEQELARFPEAKAKCQNYRTCPRASVEKLLPTVEDMAKQYLLIRDLEKDLAQLKSDRTVTNYGANPGDRIVDASVLSAQKQVRIYNDKIRALEDVRKSVLLRYPFMENGTEFRKAMLEYDRNPIATTLKVSVQAAFRKQKSSERALLIRELKKYQSYAECFQNKTSYPEACEDTQELEVGLKKADDLTGKTFVNPTQARTLLGNIYKKNGFNLPEFLSAASSDGSMAYQACMVEKSINKKEYQRTGITSAVDIALIVTPLGLAAGAIKASATAALRLASFASAVEVGGAAYYSSRSINAIAKNCVSVKAKLQSVVSEPAKADSCPSIENPISTAIKSYDDCAQAAILSAVDFGFFGVSARSARTVLNEAKAARAATPATTGSSRGTRPSGSGEAPSNKARALLPQNTFDRPLSSFENADLNNLSNAVTYRKGTPEYKARFDGGSGHVAVVTGELNGVPVFLKVVDAGPQRATGLRRTENVLDELRMNQAMSDLGVGPRSFGYTVGPDGRYRVATELLEGRTINLNQGLQADLTPRVRQQITDLQNRLERLGFRNETDPQFMITNDGRVLVIDTEFWTFNRPALNPD
jgi:hypothetical protein